MKDIPMIRIFRYALAVMIVLTIVAYSNPANAETGSVTVQQLTDVDYTRATDSGLATVNWTVIDWKTGTYGQISWFRINDSSNIYNLLNSSGQSRFTIQQGGTGGGYAYYNNYTNENITWVFDAGATMSGGHLVISYENANFTNSIQVTQTTRGAAIDPADATPVFIRVLAGGVWHIVQGTYRAEMSTETTDSYNLTYPTVLGTQYFNLNVTKGSINTKHTVSDYTETDIVMQEPNFNTGPYNLLAAYPAGLVLNVSLSGGAYTKVVLNTTNAPANNQTIPGAGGSISGQVYYDYSTATIGSLYGINASISNANFSAFTTYYLYSYNPDGTLAPGFPISFTSQSYTTGKFYTFDTSGLYNTSLKYCSTTDITCSNFLKFNLHTLDFATIYIPPATYAYTITTDKDSYVPGETITFTANNPSPTKIYMDVFEGNINTGFGSPDLGLNIEIPAGASNYPISKSIPQSITKGDYTAYLISKKLTEESFEIFASKAFNITTPDNTTNAVFIGWDRQTYNLGDTGKLTTVTDWSTDYIYVLSPSGVNKTYIYPANSTNNTMISFNEIGVWKAWITNNTGVNFYANASVFAGAPVGNETFANCLFAADYVCWDNTQYEQGDPYVLSFKLRITTLTTYNPYIAIYNPNGKIIANISINGSYDSATNTYVGSSSGSFTPQAVTGIYWARLMPDQLNREGARSSAAATVIAKVSAVTTPVGETTSENLLNSGFFAALLIMIVFAGIGMEIGGGMGTIIGFGGGFIVSAIYDLVPTWSVYLFAILVLTAFAVMVGSKVVGGNGGND